MKKEIKIRTLFLILGVMIILAGMVGGVTGTYDYYQANPAGGNPAGTLSESPTGPDGTPNQPLPDGYQGRITTAEDAIYDTGSGTVKSTKCGCEIQSGFSSSTKLTIDECEASEGGGSAKEEGKGSITPKADAAIMAVVGLVQSLASILSPVKDVLAGNKGATTTNSQSGSTDLGLNGGAQAGFANQQSAVDAAAGGACDYQNREFCENVTTKNCENMTSSTNCTSKTSEECRMQQVCVLKKEGAVAGQTIGSVLGAASVTGSAVAGSEDDSNSNLVGVKLSQNNERGKADTSIQQMGTLLASSVNLKAEVRGQMNVYTPQLKKTDITLQGASGSPAPYTDSDARYKSSITGNAIAPVESGQFVKLIKHDLSISGDEIGVDALKSLNELNANGANLDVKNGDTLIEFNKQKTYYNREIKETPYFVNQITNQNDGENYFRLLQGGSNGNYLIDDSKRTTVGDVVVAHPDATMKGIVIAKEREDMFKKGMMAKR